jgi:hypothetical protein
MTSKDRQPIQQPVTTSVLTIVQIITNLQTYVHKRSTHQPLNGG